MKNIGIIGLGLLGSALAHRFRQAGFEVLGWDLDPQRRQDLVASGGMAATSAQEVANQCQRIVFSLPTSDEVESVLTQLETVLQEGHTLVDTTTGDPERTTKIGEALAKRSISYLDATVLGSSEQARAADVIVMAGGAKDPFAACSDLFACFAKRVFHVGAWGAGARMKLVVNLVLGLHRAVLAEGLTFAQASGLDPAVALQVLRSGAASSAVMESKGRKMIEEDFTPQARLSQHLKDVRLILAQGERTKANLPLSNLHHQLLEQAEILGYGAVDNSAIIKAFA